MQRAFIFDGKAGETMSRKRQGGSCDTCINYTYDEDCQYYVCEASLDEDDMMRFLSDPKFSCPYYRLNDEYLVVRHQM